jgi:putative transposase
MAASVACAASRQEISCNCAYYTTLLILVGISNQWLTYYNSERPHSTHGILTPNEAYDSKTEPMRLAA